MKKPYFEVYDLLDVLVKSMEIDEEHLNNFKQFMGYCSLENMLAMISKGNR